jgi:hypothetical protein
MAVPEFFEKYLKSLHPDPKIALEISKLETKLIRWGFIRGHLIREEIERLKKLPNFESMAVKKTTTRKATPKKDALKKLTVPALREKAKRAGIKLSKTDGSQKTKAQLVLALDKVPTPKKKTTTRRKPATGQTGASNKLFDKRKQALAPGKRVSKTGRTYYERRANRSDAGYLLGPAAGEQAFNGWTNYWTWRWASLMIDPYDVWDAAGDIDNVYDLAGFLKDQAELIVEESSQGWAQDWLFIILNEINWREIAQAVFPEKPL